MKRVAIITAAAALLGAGVWIGRSSSSTSEASPSAPVAQVAASPRTATLPRTAVVPPRPPQLARPAVTAPLLADLADSDPKIRRAAMRDLVKSGEADPQQLLKAARDPDVGVGILAIDALGRMHAAGTVPAADLIALGADHALNERVRLTAINGFGQVPSPESAAFLSDRLANGDTFERLNAAILIGHQDLEIAMPALIKALGDSEERVRANAL